VKGLFEAEYEPNGSHEADTCGDMVPAEMHVESGHGEEDEDAERDHFLDDFELHQGEGTAVFDEAEPVGRHLQTVFEESDSPTESDDGNQRPLLEPFEFAEFEMPVPGESHEDIAADKQKDSI